MNLKMLFDEKMGRFILVGIANTIVGNGLMFLLYNLFHWGYWLSTSFSYTLASVMSYFLNRYFTFRYHGSGWRSVIRFAVNIAVCYILAYSIAKPLIYLILSGSAVVIRDNISMVCGMCLFVALNYLGQRFFAFREEKEEEKTDEISSKRNAE